MIDYRHIRPESCREDVRSRDSSVTFNYLQQRSVWEADERDVTPVEALGTTDPWGITDGAVEDE